MNRQANMPMDLFLSYKLDQCKGCISFFFNSPCGQLSPVGLTQFIWVGWGTLTSTAILIRSHLWGPLWEETEENCSLSPQHFPCKLPDPSVLAAARQRSASVLDPLLPGWPSPHYNLLITAVPLREKRGRGRESLQLDWLLLVELLLRGGLYSAMDGLMDGWASGWSNLTFRSTKCDEANLPKLLEVQTMFSVTICCFIIYQICLTQIKSYQPWWLSLLYCHLSSCSYHLYSVRFELCFRIIQFW